MLISRDCYWRISCSLLPEVEPLSARSFRDSKPSPASTICEGLVADHGTGELRDDVDGKKPGTGDSVHAVSSDNSSSSCAPNVPDSWTPATETEENCNSKGD